MEGAALSQAMRELLRLHQTLCNIFHNLEKQTSQGGNNGSEGAFMRLHCAARALCNAI